MERKKWTAENLPHSYPKCKRKELREAIQDLSDELITRSINDSKDFINRGWRDRAIAFIGLGQNELQHRNNVLMLIANGFSLLVALVAIYLSLDTNQIQIMEEQKQIQQQILEKISKSFQSE